MPAPRAQPLTERTDQLLAEIAARIQLSPTRHHQATQRYGTVAEWLERDDSPLQGSVRLLYPQGSMAIGATILSRDSDDRYDIDVVVELDIPSETPAKAVLDTLYKAVKGTKGNRYFGMTRRRSRCVTIEYADMHLDLSPMVRKPGTPEKESWLYENRRETPQINRRFTANPHGFAEWYNRQTQAEDDTFAAAFRSLAMHYDRHQVEMAAEQEPVPKYEVVENKSQSTVVLQLIKQWRNFQYQSGDDKGPPSVLLSRIVAEVSNPALTLSADLEASSRNVASFIERRIANRQPITNPVCDEDVLTDRWTVDSPEARTFVSNISAFADDIRKIRSGADTAETRKILAKMFGEYPTRDALKRYGDRLGEAIKSGRTEHRDRTASVVIPAGATAQRPRNTRPTRRHQFHRPSDA